jgi:hypothetical protein
MTHNPFEIAGDMEDAIASVQDFAHAICGLTITGSPDSEDTNSIHRLAPQIVENSRDLEEQRFRAWRLLNPHLGRGEDRAA